MNIIRLPIRRIAIQRQVSDKAVKRIQCQNFATTSRCYALAKRNPNPSQPSPAPAPAPAAPEAEPKPKVPDLPDLLPDAPRAYGKAVDSYEPKPLSRPIGLPTPPVAGQNNGVDNRTWSQKRDDFVNYDKHLEKRRMLTQKISTPYFREWSNMRFSKGKTFLAPPRLFKGSHALYFPNLHGETLVKEKENAMKDTTTVLEGRVSVVTVFSSAWAEAQVASFASLEKNPELMEVLKGGGAQLVQINVEENALKAGIISLFKGSLRKRVGEENWGRYFVVKKGLSDDARERIGVLNSKVGYVYLLDGECKIRWAGSGVASDEERAGLVRGVRKLIEEAKMPKVVAKPEVKKVTPKRPVPNPTMTPEPSRVAGYV